MDNIVMINELLYLTFVCSVKLIVVPILRLIIKQLKN